MKLSSSDSYISNENFKLNDKKVQTPHQTINDHEYMTKVFERTQIPWYDITTLFLIEARVNLLSTSIPA